MGILQARILEWVAIPSCRGSSQPSDWTQISLIAEGPFTIWATREAGSYLPAELNVRHWVQFSSVQSLSHVWLFATPCSTPAFTVQLLEFTQTHIHWMSDAIQPSHPLSSPSPLTFNLSHKGLFKWVSSSHQVAKVLEFQLQHQSFQWTLRTDFL